MRIVLVGPPGAGKGTQAKFISAKFGIPPISTGEIFRANVSAATEMGVEAKKYMDAGDLVPDEVTVAMVRDRLAEDDTAPGFLLDGFPRTVPQAVALTKTLDGAGKPLDVVLELRMDDEQVIRRLAGRRTCRKCSHLWHLEFDPPKVEGVCDLCGSELFQRDDDMPETISRRIDVYSEQTQPLLGHYAEHGLLVTIEATGSVDEVAERAIAALRQFA